MGSKRVDGQEDFGTDQEIEEKKEQADFIPACSLFVRRVSFSDRSRTQEAQISMLMSRLTDCASLVQIRIKQYRQRRP
jgi:hypothetical protein